MLGAAWGAAEASEAHGVVYEVGGAVDGSWVDVRARLAGVHGLADRTQEVRR